MVLRFQNEDCVVTDRCGIVENRYCVHVAVVDSDGRLLFAVGDPSRLTLARSAAKPAQALAIYETGGFEQSGFDDADLALMCASHSSEERHISRARAMLMKTGATEQDLRCGGHPALSETINRGWIKHDFLPTGLYNNCSGKHAGMLAGAKAIRGDFADYHLSSHPMQSRVRQVFEDLSGDEAEELRWGIDGCNLPAPASPLHVLAKIYAFFATAADMAIANASSTNRIQASARIFQAMTKHPELVGGDGRFCTELMTAYQGSLIGKLGADGCYGVGVRASEQTRRLGANGALGIAVKIEDGNISILYSAVTEVLKQLGIGTKDNFQALSRFHCQEILNTVGVVTGHVSHLFKVRRV